MALLVSADPTTVRNSMSAITTGAGFGIPAAYPLGINGFRGVRGMAGLMGFSGLGAVKRATQNAGNAMKMHAAAFKAAARAGNRPAMAYHAGQHAKAKSATLQGLGMLAASAKQTAEEKKQAELAVKQAQLQAAAANAAPGSKAAAQAARQLTTVSKQLNTANAAVTKQAAAAQASTAKQQARVAAAAQKKATEAAAEAQKKAAAAQKKQATAAAHAQLAQQHAAAAAAHKQAAATAKANRQDATAAKHTAAAAAHAAKAADHGKAAKANASGSASDNAASIIASAKSLAATLQTKIASAKTKKATKKLRGLFGLSMRGYGFGRLGDIVVDPSSSTGYTDTITGQPAQPPLATSINSGAATINPATGQPYAGSSYSGSCNNDPTVSAVTTLITSMGSENAVTAPKNCKPGSSRPVCVIYQASQAQQQEMQVVLALLGQLMQEFCQLSQGIGTQGGAYAGQGGCPAGYQLDPAGSGACLPIGAGGATGCPQGYTLDPAGSGACVSLSSVTGAVGGQIYPGAGYSPSGQPIIQPGAGYAGPTGAPAGMPTFPGGGGSPYAINPATGLPGPGASLPPTTDAYGNPIDPSSGLPVGAAPLPPIPYGPGGGIGPYDPNLPAEYAGMPSPTDPYGDVANIPSGFDDGSGGSDSSQFIPTSVPVSMGPIAYMDFSGDVQPLPSDGGGGTDDGSLIPSSVDAYAGPGMIAQGYAPQGGYAPSYAPYAPQGQQAQAQLPPMGVQQGQPQARQALPPPKSAVAQDQVPQQMVQSAPDEQQPGAMSVQDEGAIVAEAFDGDGGDSGIGA